MEIYLIPIKSALVVFPIIALLFTLPYMVVQYKKFGAIPFWRTAVLYSFMLYLVNMYFFVILPLPPEAEVAQYTGPSMQLIPFQFVSDFIQKSNFDIRNPGTYAGALMDASFFVVLFNLLLFVPLGMYLRYYFKCTWKKTLVLSFGVSLFFELTQLSGLYGIYSRAYRLFDVDDLLLNTLGGMSGFWMTPLVCHFLPTRERIDEMAYERGERVTLLRRGFALALDWAMLASLLFFLSETAGFLSSILPVLTVYYILLPYSTGGFTFGKWFFRMKLVTEKGEKPHLIQYAARYGLLYGFLLAMPVLFFVGVAGVSLLPHFFLIVLGLFVVFAGGMWLLFLWESLVQLFGSRRDYFYGRISGTRNQSTIRRRKGQDTAGNGARGEAETEPEMDKIPE